jgi:dethiobiotin synthetase
VRSLFVTGSGTGVGKTFVMRALIGELRGRLRVSALKPIASGFDAAAPENSDTGMLLEALGQPVTGETVERVSPWRFAAPLSPDMAAAREGRSIDLDEVVGFCRQGGGGADVLLIEGIGGVMVPIDESRTVLDWITALEAPALLVVGSYLGTLSHTLTAAGALRSRGVATSVVVSESEQSPVPLAETVATLRRHLPGVRVAALPRAVPESRRSPAAEHLASELFDAGPPDAAAGTWQSV